MNFLSSMIETDAISNWLATNYALPEPILVSLIRSYTNDVYLVQSAEHKFVLKIYRLGWRNKAEIAYEVELLAYLDEKGLRVAKAVSARDGDLVKSIQTPGGVRLAVLFEHAPGKKPVAPFSNELYFAFGRAIGMFHRLSDEFCSVRQRKPMDLEYLIDMPLAVVRPYLNQRSGQWEKLLHLAHDVKARVTAMVEQGLDWGPIHFDATLDNLHVMDDGEIILFDFDSGGPGWRACDLQGWAVSMPERQEHYRFFLRGYQTAKPLSPLDLQAAPWLTIAYEIWTMKVEIENRLYATGQEHVENYLSEQIGYVERLYQYHLGRLNDS